MPSAALFRGQAVLGIRQIRRVRKTHHVLPVVVRFTHPTKFATAERGNESSMLRKVAKGLCPKPEKTPLR